MGRHERPGLLGQLEIEGFAEATSPGGAEVKWELQKPAEWKAAVVCSPEPGSLFALGLWGPRARDILASVTRDDVSNEAFPFATCRTIEVGPLRVLASRISYVGDLGWELYVPMSQAADIWEALLEAGEPLGVRLVGGRVLRVSGIARGNPLEDLREEADGGLEQARRDAALIDELGLKLAWTLDTHVHADHISGGPALADRKSTRLNSSHRC